VTAPAPVSDATVASIADAIGCRPVDGPVPVDAWGARSLARPGDAFPVTDLGPTTPFAQTLAARRSHRRLGCPSAAEVGTVLARAGLVRARRSGIDGYSESSRPTPSPGARHPHVLVLLVRDVTGLPPGSWVLDPDRACLLPGNYTRADRDRALAAVADAMRIPGPPPAAVLTVARPALLLDRYPAGMPLLWRDAGALQATVHLAAADVGLGSCVVGTAGILHSYGDDGLLDTGAVALGTVR
jgi:SagB-type dehydrogenase family enzyme